MGALGIKPDLLSIMGTEYSASDVARIRPETFFPCLTSSAAEKILTRGGVSNRADYGRLVALLDIQQTEVYAVSPLFASRPEQRRRIAAIGNDPLWHYEVIRVDWLPTRQTVTIKTVEDRTRYVQNVYGSGTSYGGEERELVLRNGDYVILCTPEHLMRPMQSMPPGLTPKDRLPNMVN